MKKLNIKSGALIDEIDDYAVYEGQLPGSGEFVVFYVPRLREQCTECNGRGYLEGKFTSEPCFDCFGLGTVAYGENWDAALTSEQWHEEMRQRNYLRRRYGVENPKSIADYWQKVMP